MGFIRVKTDDGMQRVRIAGDEPTSEELSKIQNYFSPSSKEVQRTSFADLMNQVRSASRDEGFDYETGADSGLRAKISFGETAEEQEAILAKEVGIDGYTRDSFGRLALTPEGQRKRGMKNITGNLIIEDEGFSVGDIADLTGILPETIGSVAGAILGLPGGLIGSSAGAAVGAAAGQTIEEGIESLLGVQKQTLGEVAGDVATEAAIAGTVELVTLGTFNAIRGGLNMGKGALSKPLEQATIEGSERGARLIEEGAAPSLERLGAPATLSYAQKLAEGATKDTTRVLKNTNFALNKVEELKNIVGKAEIDDAGAAFSNVAGRRFTELKQAQKEASDASMKAVKDSINVIERSLDEGFDINDSTLQAITGAFQNFSRVSGGQFRVMDEMLSKLQFEDASGAVKDGAKARIINTNILEGAVKDLEEVVGSRSVLPQPVQQAMRGIEELSTKGKGKASFEQIANQRKLVNDALFDNDLGSATTEQLFKLRAAFDSTLEAVNLKEIEGLARGQKKQLSAIAKQRELAFNTYREGLKVFDDLQKFGVIRNIKAASKDPRFNVDQFFKKVIRPNSPERLKAVFAAVDNPEIVRSQLARAYLDDAMQRTGVDLMDPASFNGMRFMAQIDSLGTTGRELFGESWPQVQNLSKTIAQSGPNKIDADVVQRIMTLDADKPLIASLKELADAKQALGAAQKTKVIRDFNEGILSPEDAAAYIASPSRSITEINQIKNFFKDDPEALDTIKQFVLNDIVSSVGDDVFTDTTKALSLDRLVNKQYKPGVLNALLGEKTAEGLKQFAGDLAYLGDVGKEGAIVAATFAAHPISKAGAKARMTFTSKLFANERIMKAFARKGQGLPDPQRFGGKVANALDAAVVGVGATMRPIRQAGIRAAIAPSGPIQQDSEQIVATTSPIQASGLGAVDVTQPIPQTGTIAPVQPQTFDKSKIRQMATNNPAVAQALGIRGATAGLL
jgi:hypothetical protein